MSWVEPDVAARGPTTVTSRWAQWWWRTSETARLGYREHRAEEPWSITLTTRWPRALLQCLFFTMIGRVVGGEDGQAFTFVGSVAIIMPLFTMALIADTPMRDRWNATFYRIRGASLPVPLIYVIRCWPAVAEAAVAALTCIPIVGLVTGQMSLAVELLTLFPIYLLMAITSAAAGLAAASVALFGRGGNDIIVGNLGMYGLIAASGAIIPPGRVAWLDIIGSVLPMRHGIEAIRHHLAGEPWLVDVLTEAVVGIGWLLIAIVLYSALTRRVRHTDHDKVT